MMRVPINLLKIETDSDKIPDLPEFKIGDCVKFSYRGKSVRGYIRRINRTTITVDSEIGRIRASPTRLIATKIEEPLNISKKIGRPNYSKNDKKVSYYISNSSMINRLSNNILINMKSEINDLAKGLRDHNDDLINMTSNNIAFLFTEYYNLPPVKIYTKGKRIRIKNRQTLGVHRTRDIGSKNQRSSISVFSRTAVRDQYVKLKTYMNTLIHELMHHYDRYFLKIPHCYHTKGFYKRVNTLYDQLKPILKT